MFTDNCDKNGRGRKGECETAPALDPCARAGRLVMAQFCAEGAAYGVTITVIV